MAGGESTTIGRLIAAHRTLPFGTRVRVTNLANGRSVVVTIKDRGPSIRHRVIDLSGRAARELGFVREGMRRCGWKFFRDSRASPRSRPAPARTRAMDTPHGPAVPVGQFAFHHSRGTGPATIRRIRSRRQLLDVDEHPHPPPALRRCSSPSGDAQAIRRGREAALGRASSTSPCDSSYVSGCVFPRASVSITSVTSVVPSAVISTTSPGATKSSETDPAMSGGSTVSCAACSSPAAGVASSTGAAGAGALAAAAAFPAGVSCVVHRLGRRGFGTLLAASDRKQPDRQRRGHQRESERSQLVRTDLRVLHCRSPIRLNASDSGQVAGAFSRSAWCSAVLPRRQDRGGGSLARRSHGCLYTRDVPIYVIYCY